MKPRDLTRLFATEAPRLLRRLRGFRGRVPAEDIVQSAFAKMLEQDMAAIEDPKAYLTRLVRNLAVDELRRQERSGVASFTNEDLEEIFAGAPSPHEPEELSPEEALIARERLAHMAGAIRALPDRERRALYLQKSEGLTHQQIGERLGVSTHSVPRYLSRALAKCAKAAAEFEAGDVPTTSADRQ
jgi:RNA polymerase sigma factor (sigma-70 family)